MIQGDGTPLDKIKPEITNIVSFHHHFMILKVSTFRLWHVCLFAVK